MVMDREKKEEKEKRKGRGGREGLGENAYIDLFLLSFHHIPNQRNTQFIESSILLFLLPESSPILESWLTLLAIIMGVSRYQEQFSVLILLFTSRKFLKNSIFGGLLCFALYYDKLNPESQTCKVSVCSMAELHSQYTSSRILRGRSACGPG